MTTVLRRAIAELVGTAVLVFFGVGSAVFGIKDVGAVGVALAFGFVLLALAYAIGPISGCHINPAVTLGVLMSKGIDLPGALYYWAAQIVGGIVGAAGVALILGVGNVADQTHGKGSNNWGTAINGPGAFILEIILTFLLVLVVLMVTADTAVPGFVGLAVGTVLTVVHLVGIPLDGTSVNPARSIGPALFQGGSALAHVWLFILAPLLGGAIAAVLARFLQNSAKVVIDAG